MSQEPSDNAECRPLCVDLDGTLVAGDLLVESLRRAGFDSVLLEAAGPAYRPISTLRHHTPPLRSVALRALPTPLVRFLRRRTVTRPLQTFAAREPFSRRAPNGIWLRALLRLPS